MLPRPESHDNCSQMKTYCSDRIWGRRKEQTSEKMNRLVLGLTTTEYSRSTWQYSIWLNGKIVAYRARYNTESVFVLEHTDTPKAVVNVASQTVAYQEESHTTNPTCGHTWGLTLETTLVQSTFRSIQSISASMDVFAFMCKLDGRKHKLRAQGSWPVELEMS
jgi:hypothetical protein